METPSFVAQQTQKQQLISCVDSTHVQWTNAINSLISFSLLQCTRVYKQSHCQGPYNEFTANAAMDQIALNAASSIGPCFPTNDKRKKRYSDHNPDAIRRKELWALRTYKIRIEHIAWNHIMRRFYKRLYPFFQRNVKKWPTEELCDDWSFFLNETIKNQTKQYERVMEVMSDFMSKLHENVVFWMKKARLRFTELCIAMAELYSDIENTLDFINDELYRLKNNTNPWIQDEIKGLRWRKELWKTMEKKLRKSMRNFQEPNNTDSYEKL